ncbi:hypothetical protein KZZ52_39490 [Dactylosporangium sp. AC04546]|uniref:hypothetical protein n=1 Tax=Dactylosporangium sp. AC04546 TaxID=2862460 RepID=UPI001EE00599|nr:hypothetical protein [Dactylosporangium sp. AC04546]WVK80034.1 hypothetical protein KZZ52_39490 [Dactylosporangium sp. AC04546]
MERTVVGGLVALAVAALMWAAGLAAPGGADGTAAQALALARGLSPAERLLTVAQRAGPAPGDLAAGGYSRIHLRRVTRVGGRPVVWDSVRWRAADGSGRLAERRLTARGGPGPATVTDYPPGALEVAGPTVVTSVLDLVGLRYLDLAERAAVLRVVAGLPGLAYRGPGDAGTIAFTVDVGGTPLTLAVRTTTGEIDGWDYSDAQRVVVVDRTRVAALS